MGYYNQALTDYVGKICDVERELYTTQRLIANLDYQMQRLGHPREVDPPEPTDGGNPFVQNGGWYMVFLLGIPISGSKHLVGHCYCDRSRCVRNGLGKHLPACCG